MTTEAPAEPPASCARCPRLVDYRRQNAVANPGWFNGAVPSFGPETARLLVVGLAPGMTGANRTGRPFTGDWAGELLYDTLAQFSFSRGQYDRRSDDGLELVEAMITNSVRCVPPQNKPVGAEITACRDHLAARIAALPRLEVIVTLGKIAHDSTVRALGLKLKDHPFGHGAAYTLASPRPLTLIASYHCSRYNTNTRRLTPDMFGAVFARVRELLDSAKA